jgi:Zn-dependent peptidase ImmA (M78 family)
MTETELMVVLLRWINKHSSFNHDLNDLPRILKVNKTQIAQIAFGRTLPAAIDPDTLGIKGLYNFNNRTIYILDNLDLSVEGDRAILLHELVHYLQYRYGDDKGAECKNELEKLAYRLEAEYLHSHNHKINFNANHIENVSRCT